MTAPDGCTAMEREIACVGGSQLVLGMTASRETVPGGWTANGLATSGR